VSLAAVEAAIATHGSRPEALIPLLQAIQRHYRWLPPEALRHLAERTGIHPTAITGVATFYDQFRHRPAGRHLVHLCHGTACHVKGSGQIEAALRRHLGIAAENDTDAAGVFTIQAVACLGCCTLAPVVQIAGVTYGHLTPERVPAMLADVLERERGGVITPPASPPPGADGPLLRIGSGSCCVANGSQLVREALEREFVRSGASATVMAVGCVGMCHRTPLFEVVDRSRPQAVPELYANVKPADAAAIVRRHLRPRSLTGRIRRFADTVLDRLSGEAAVETLERVSVDHRDPQVCSFLGPQLRIATEYSGELDPLDLDAYLAKDGFVALRQVLQAADPEALIATMTQSGLRGRGGAGFPTGRKWLAARKSSGSAKYVVCNGDEGDPGAFMDRMILESVPYRVLEGLAIAALAVGASEGVLYIRAEYPLAVARIRAAIAVLAGRGLLGARLDGSGPPLRLRVVEGAGAFVCGEETALIASVEGRRGTPRLRPPFPAESGLWGRPTCVNNVETLALVPWIVRHGAAAFAKLGTPGSSGTKVFALAGKIARGGLIEVPMGVSLRSIIEDIGGGIAGGGTLKAVQIGGPSGGCLPASMCDQPVDYDALAKAGAIMGSGGLVVLDERDCMVDIARYFLKFTQDQSCGKCTFCRLGTRRMLDILDRLCAGTGKAGDLETLEELARTVKASSLCGLGQTAPNPVLTTLHYFRAEYEAHLAGHCPAGKCSALIRYEVVGDCTGCTTCAQLCPVAAIPFTPYRRHSIDAAICTRCDQCRGACPEHAIAVVS
jgi:NADH-quinone oxidoreductase subunit F